MCTWILDVVQCLGVVVCFFLVYYVIIIPAVCADSSVFVERTMTITGHVSLLLVMLLRRLVVHCMLACRSLWTIQWRFCRNQHKENGRQP